MCRQCVPSLPKIIIFTIRYRKSRRRFGGVPSKKEYTRKTAHGGPQNGCTLLTQAVKTKDTAGILTYDAAHKASGHTAVPAAVRLRVQFAPHVKYSNGGCSGFEPDFLLHLLS